jgi:hypothetical protein
LTPRSEDWPYRSRRALASSSLTQALDLEPQGGDLTVLASDRGVPLGEPRLGGVPRRTLGTQHRVRRGEVVGQEVEAVHTGTSST